MFHKIISLLPDSVVRFAGRLQFKLPFLKLLINRVGRLAATGEGVIQRGVGKGLRFDATSCNPGFLLGTSEPQEQQLLASMLGPGTVFYDIGANAGFYAVIGARCVGPSGHVYAFEPTPELADRVRHNARINDLDNITVVEAAVCDKDGSIDFGTEGFSVTNSITKVDSASIRVKAVTLDVWAKDKRPPDVILMDIEGAEIDALNGAMNLIRSNRPALLVEVHWLGQEFVDFVEEKLRPLGYTATTYSRDALPTGLERYHALLIPEDVHDA